MTTLATWNLFLQVNSMAEFIVRVWVDLLVKAKTEQEARAIVGFYEIGTPETPQVEHYDEQVAGVWKRESE